MRRIRSALAGAALLALVFGITDQTDLHAAVASKPHKTVITTEHGDTFVFSPRKLTIKGGTRVTWSNPANAAQIGHNVTSDTSSWHFTKDLPSGGAVNFTFKKAGTYHYECTLHPGMKAEIVVKK